MPYYIYGKRLKEFNGGGPDKTFRALNYMGRRTTTIRDAYAYETKQDAINRLTEALKKKNSPNIDEVIFEIRYK